MGGWGETSQGDAHKSIVSGLRGEGETMSDDNLERCTVCDEPTGRAGRGDDSLYDDGGGGPYCSGCWQDLMTDEEDGNMDLQGMDSLGGDR